MKPTGMMFSRRSILKIASSSTFVTVLSGFSSGCGTGRADLETITRHMISMLHYPKHAHRIGTSYISQTPRLQEKSFEHLTREILATLGHDQDDLPKEHLESLPTRLREQVRKDFVHENVVVVDGFMLSKTEALLCSLVATYNI